jgi:DNA-binding transcriptional regulator LsrR (DeoR family)
LGAQRVFGFKEARETLLKRGVVGFLFSTFFQRGGKIGRKPQGSRTSHFVGVIAFASQNRN